MTVKKSVNLTRVIIALLVAPLATPTVFLFYRVLLAGDKTPADTIAGIYLTYGPYSYLVTLLLGVPILYMFHRADFRKLVYFIAGGAALGLVPALVVGFIGIGQLPIYTLCIISGLLSAVVFWVLSGWRNVGAV